MLKDQIDFDAQEKALADYIAGKGPEPPDIAELVTVKKGDKCDGCGQPLEPGIVVQKCLADGTIGHPECHVGGQFPPRKRRQYMFDAHGGVGALIDKWRWSETARPNPGRVADYLADLVSAFRNAKTLDEVARVTVELDSLRASLDAATALWKHKESPYG